MCCMDLCLPALPAWHAYRCPAGCVDKQRVWMLLTHRLKMLLAPTSPRSAIGMMCATSCRDAHGSPPSASWPPGALASEAHLPEGSGQRRFTANPVGSPAATNSSHVCQHACNPDFCHSSMFEWGPLGLCHLCFAPSPPPSCDPIPLPGLFPACLPSKYNAHPGMLPWLALARPGRSVRAVNECSLCSCCHYAW